MTITLRRDIERLARQRAADRGFSDVSDYLAQLIAADGDDLALEAELLPALDESNDSDINIQELRAGGRALRERR
ncbi:hypothetical protein [Arenibaculum sp.]|uniref:hypothetical protein n=1 Tax=Arenibaculum sp. TaxID=2865862 RepID=UPI002E14349D|nr:hypothetical protein [Arenibaculum sp.]